MSIVSWAVQPQFAVDAGQVRCAGQHQRALAEAAPCGAGRNSGPFCPQPAINTGSTRVAQAAATLFVNLFRMPEIL